MTTQAHTSRAHAKLAPSAAHRWLHCAGSVRMSEGIPNTSSSFAAEGTAAHELAAHCLESGQDPATFLDMWIDIKPDHPMKWVTNLDEAPSGDDAMRFFLVDDEMVEAVGMYCEHVESLKGDGAIVEVEQKLDMTHLHPQIWGTGDATVFNTGDRHLHVVDLKYGKGVAVDADDNPQLLLYAAGAARRHHNQQIARLTMHIVQPRAPHAKGPIRSYDIDLLDLFEFEDTLAMAAKATEADDAPTHAGDWCRFCPALAICATARESALQAAADDFGAIDLDGLPSPEGMSADHRGRVLREADRIHTWVKAVQEFEHAQACAGSMPTGFKLVAKRATRKWRDEESARSHMESVLGVKEIDIFTEPKLKSPAQLEKWFPGKNVQQRQAAMGDLVEKRSSGTNLVPVDDPRPPVHVGPGADFEAVEVEG